VDTETTMIETKNADWTKYFPMKKVMHHMNIIVEYAIPFDLSAISTSSQTLSKKTNLKMKMSGYGIKRKWRLLDLARGLTSDLVGRRLLASIRTP
jgi:hypothetical protein